MKKELKLILSILIMIACTCSIKVLAFDETLNLANGKSAVARDSRDFDGYGINPSFATDNSMTTHWCAQWDGAGNGSWIYVDLENYFMINKVIIDWRGSRWPNGSWKLQVATNMPDGSGNSNWVDVYLGNAGTDVVNGTGTYNFTATAGRYVRMLGASQSNGYGYNIFEIRVYANENALPQGAASSMMISPSSKILMVGQQFQFQSGLIAANGIPMNAVFTPTWSLQESSGATINSSTGVFKATQTGTYTINCNTTYESSSFSSSATVTVNVFDVNQNLALNKTSTTSGQTASNGNDGSLITRWRSNPANQQEWWQVDLGVEYAVNNVKIKMNGDAGARNATYNILVSLTGLEGSWQTMVTNAQIPAGSGTELNNHTFISTPARFVKYQGLTRGGWDHNFADFEVFATGFYSSSTSSEFTSVQFSNASVIQNEEVALTIVTNDQESNPYTNATITSVVVTEGNAAGVNLVERNNIWYATGVIAGTYTLTATGVDNTNETLVKTGIGTLTVTDARRVASINLTTPFPITKYATNRTIDLNVSCVDQYGATISPSIIWDIQGAAGGSVTNNKYTPANKGTGTIKATVNTSNGLVESQSRTFDVITNAANVAYNKPVTSISTATTSGSNAVDNNLATQWIVPDAGNRTYDAWFVIDLESEYFIEFVEVIWEGAFSKTFTVDYSTNGIDYTSKYSFTNTDGVETKINKFYSNPSTARFVRIFSTLAGTQYGTKLLDVYVHGKSTTITLDNNTTLSSTDFTTEQLINTEIIVNSGTFTVDQNSTIKSLAINSGAKLTLDAGKTLTANSLSLNSDASGTATFVDNGTATISSATVQQYLTASRNWYISSPIASGTTANLNLGTSVQTYSESAKTWSILSSGNALEVGKGYVSVAGAGVGSTGTVNFSGSLNTGTITVPVSRTESGNSRGFNLVANPYPSYIDWSLVMADAANANIVTTMWFRTKTTGGAYTFSTYNSTGNESVANGAATTISKFIPPMQAFWVRVNANVGQTTYSTGITFKNTMRAHRDDNGNKFKAPKQDERKRMRLQVSNGTNTDETLLYFDAEASDNFDAFDSPKMFSNISSMPEIYTKVDNQQLVINGLNKIADKSQIALGYTTGIAGILKLKVTELNNFDASTKAYLIDNLENTETELTAATEYSFNSAITTNNENRFSLQFRAPDVATDFVASEKPNVQVFVNTANQIAITAPEKSNFAIYNAVGQLIEDGKITSYTQTSNIKLSAGVYLVKVKNQTTRLIIK